ncbi:MAG: hypothetical protein K2K40_06850 [Paramuribaculum sp.]|nr:hypothetical protein [Paramuribaculum sp.]
MRNLYVDLDGAFVLGLAEALIDFPVKKTVAGDIQSYYSIRLACTLNGFGKK